MWFSSRPYKTVSSLSSLAIAASNFGMLSTVRNFVSFRPTQWFKSPYDFSALLTKIDDIFVSASIKKAISEEVANTPPRYSGSIIGMDPNSQVVSGF